MLRDPVSEYGRAVLEIEQVEPAEHRAILADEHVEDTGASLLLGQQGVVPLGEVVVELIAAVGDKGGEVGAVRQLEGQDRWGVIGAQALQLGHARLYPDGSPRSPEFPRSRSGCAGSQQDRSRMATLARSACGVAVGISAGTSASAASAVSARHAPSETGSADLRDMAQLKRHVV